MISRHEEKPKQASGYQNPMGMSMSKPASGGLTRVRRHSCVFALLLIFLGLVFSVNGDSTTGQISDAEAVSFVKNTWGWTSFADNVIIIALDDTYQGIPYRDYIKAIIVGLEIHHYYAAGQDNEATRVMMTYASTNAVKLSLASVGLKGVSTVASAASWPIDWSIGLVRSAAHDKAYRTEKALYFAIRPHVINLQEILDADAFSFFEADGVNGGNVVMTKEGWLRPGLTTDTTAFMIPGMTPIQAFSRFETEWQCKQSSAKFYADNETLREAFGSSVLPAAPTITADLSDQSIRDGDVATFTVSASGAEPLRYVWEVNGSLNLVAVGPTFTASAAGQYRVTVYDTNNLCNCSGRLT